MAFARMLYICKTLNDMKKYIIILFVVAGLAACKNTTETTEETTTVAGSYGDSTFIPQFAWETTTLIDSLQGRDSIEAKVTGTIKAACQAKGCWMTMDADGQEIFVKFKDYSFFVPKNSAGYTATMLGWGYVDTVSVAQQIEYAKDAEKSSEEIAAITEPEVKFSFMADGVIIE